MATRTERIEVVRRACQQISPIYPDYATWPIQDGFSWSSSLAGCAFERLYLVVFRSVRRASADLDLLRDPDGNGVELYRDRPQDEWPRTADGELAMVTRPLDVEGLLSELG
jgi:hypothetical protein